MTIRPGLRIVPSCGPHRSEDLAEVHRPHTAEFDVVDFLDRLGQECVAGDRQDVERRVGILDAVDRYERRAGLAVCRRDGVADGGARAEQDRGFAGKFEVVHHEISRWLGTKPVGPTPPARPPPSMMNICPVTYRDASEAR